MRKRVVFFLAAILASTALTSTVVAVPPALAATPPAKTCGVGETIDHGVFARLVVDGTSCTANHVRVESGGTFVLNAGASFTADASAFTGTVDVSDGYLTMTSSTVRSVPSETGGIAPTTHGAVSVTNSSVYGDIAGDIDGGWGQAGLFTLRDSVVTSGGPATSGSVRVEGLLPALRAVVSNVRIDGHLALRSSAMTVDYAHIGRGASFEYPAALEMCAVHVVGDLRVEHVAFGAGAVLGGYLDPTKTCGGGVKVRVDGDLVITANAGPVDLRHVTVTGRLDCTGNATKPVLRDVTAGTRLGQCA